MFDLQSEIDGSDETEAPLDPAVKVFDSLEFSLLDFIVFFFRFFDLGFEICVGCGEN